MKTKILITLLFVLTINTIGFSQIFNKPGAGVTIIIHGWNPDNSQPTWMTTMANAIINRSGGIGQIGTITVTGTKGNLTATCSNWNFNLATATSGEIVILVNWTAVADNITTGVTAQEVAATVAPLIYESQNSQPALSELPIHLIGHSRGGGMVYEIARLLGLQGIEIEQVTSLDPHPLTASDPQGVAEPIGPGQTIDTPIALYENILFVDNYYQNINYPEGQYLTGAYNRLWTSLPGGYNNVSGYTYNILGTNYNFSDHLNIILMYYGTINLSTPASDGEASMDTTERGWFNAYEDSGKIAGFYYSRIIGGNRLSNDIPNGGDEIIAGYNNNSLLGGSGARASLTWTSAVWPNVITSSVLKSGVALQTGLQTLTANEELQINYTYRSYANASEVTFYVDTDRNPYNNNISTIGEQDLLSTDTVITQSTMNWTVTGLTSGTQYYVYSKISDGTHTRYQYLNYQFSIPCIVNIPDSNFKNALLAIPGLDANSDGEIECSEATAYNGAIEVDGQNISDLTGIEAFTNITELDCDNNSLTSLNVSSDTSLTYLSCNNNSLTTLNDSGLHSLNNLECSNNSLTTLNVSSDTSLTYLSCDNNSLTTLNVSGLHSLNVLNCNNNSLTSLNVSSDTSLTYLFCNNNSLTALDVSGLYSLIDLVCDNNSLTSLNVPGLQSLIDLACNNNSLTSLNVSSLYNLNNLICNNNSLTTLNVSYDSTLQELNCYNNLLTSLNTKGLTSLNYLDCDHCQLTSLDVSSITALQSLFCYNNKLTTLNISSDTTLQSLVCYTNSLTDLDVSSNKNLQILNCDTNLLIGLDVSSNSYLINLVCNNNSLTSLNVKNGNNINFNVFDAINNPDLACIQVDNATWSTVNWTNIDPTASFSVDCGASTDTITVSVSPANSGKITGAGIYNSGDNVTLTAIADTGYIFENWTDSGSVVSTNASFSFTANANRTLVANFSINTGIENIFKRSSISIFPNPAHDFITLNTVIEGVLTMTDVSGRIIKQVIITSNETKINVSQLPKGCYIISIQSEDGVVSSKLIVE